MSTWGAPWVSHYRAYQEVKKLSFPVFSWEDRKTRMISGVVFAHWILLKNPRFSENDHSWSESRKKSMF
jgi:hypothetical protein